MYSKVIPRLIFAVLWAVAIPVISEPIENANRPTLTVIYETYCPDSVKFITKQFYPWYISLDSKALDVDMNPAGNTTVVSNRTSEALQFVCEHGPKECYANEIHACVLNASTLSIEKKLAFINCTMATVDLNGNQTAYENTTVECAKAAGFNRSEILSCDAVQGSKVLKSYVDRIMPFKTAPIPSVILNGEFNATFSKNAVDNIANSMCEWAKLKNATKELCKPNGNSASTFGVTLPMIVITFLIVKLFQ